MNPLKKTFEPKSLSGLIKTKRQHLETKADSKQGEPLREKEWQDLQTLKMQESLIKGLGRLNDFPLQHNASAAVFDPALVHHVEYLWSHIDEGVGKRATKAVHFKASIVLELLNTHRMPSVLWNVVRKDAELHELIKKMFETPTAIWGAKKEKMGRGGDWGSFKKQLKERMKQDIPSLLPAVEALSAEDWMLMHLEEHRLKKTSKLSQCRDHLEKNTVNVAESWLLDPEVMASPVAFQNIYTMQWHQGFWHQTAFWNDTGFLAAVMKGQHPLVHFFKTQPAEAWDAQWRVFESSLEDPALVPAVVTAVLTHDINDVNPGEAACQWAVKHPLPWGQMAVKDQTALLLKWQWRVFSTFKSAHFKPSPLCQRFTASWTALYQRQMKKVQGLRKKRTGLQQWVEREEDPFGFGGGATEPEQKEGVEKETVETFYTCPVKQEGPVDLFHALSASIQTSIDKEDVQRLWVMGLQKSMAHWGEGLVDIDELTNRLEAFGTQVLPALVERRWVPGDPPEAWPSLSVGQIQGFQSALTMLALDLKEAQRPLWRDSQRPLERLFLDIRNGFLFKGFPPVSLEDLEGVMGLVDALTQDLESLCTTLKPERTLKL